MFHRYERSSRRWAAIGALAVVLVVTAPSITNAGPAQVDLGKAHGFAVLAGAGITNAGTSTVRGDVGSYPTGTITGFAACPAADCVNLDGTNHVGDPVTKRAEHDLVAAYNDAAGRTPDTLGTELGGTTVTPGVYSSGSGTFEITGTLKLDAKGNPNAVFIFQMASTLTTATGSRVILRHGARACNVFWQVGSSATLGTSSSFRGSVLAFSSVTVTDGVKVIGRVLARNGAVTLDTNTIKRPLHV